MFRQHMFRSIGMSRVGAPRVLVADPRGVGRGMSEQVSNVASKVALVIDDIMSARMVLSDMLKDLGFETCLEAKDGHEALKLLESNPVQLIFCDFLMNGMNGMEFLKALKEQHGESIPPVVFVSSIGDVQSVDAALRLGATDYLVKPLNFRKLRRKVDSVLGGQECPNDPVSPAR